jgi:outer membrane protein insertion porin family
LAEVNFGLPISATSRAGLGLRYQYTKFHAGEYSELAQDFVERNGNKFNDVFLTLRYTKDSRDSAIFPTKGTLQALYGEIAVPGSDLEFYRVTYRGRQYIPLTRRFTFAARADIGYGAGYGNTSDMPFFNNFYAGGPGSVRGWEAYSLGPRETTDENDPVGGNLKLTGSLELFAPPPVGGKFENTLRLGAFFDFGNVWWTKPTDLVAPTEFDLGDLRYSAGLSLAWLSPVGALSLSVAYPINAKDDDHTQVFQFSFGQNF